MNWDLFFSLIDHSTPKKVVSYIYTYVYEKIFIYIWSSLLPVLIIDTINDNNNNKIELIVVLSICVGLWNGNDCCRDCIEQEEVNCLWWWLSYVGETCETYTTHAHTQVATIVTAVNNIYIYIYIYMCVCIYFIYIYIYTLCMYLLKKKHFYIWQGCEQAK